MNDLPAKAGRWARLLAWLRAPRSVPEDDAPFEITVGESEPLYGPPEPLAVEALLQKSSHHFPAEDDAPLVSVSASALRRMVLHAESDLEVEVGGICLGRVYESAEARLMIVIEQAITSSLPGGFVHERASLTFTAAAWSSMMDEADEKHGELRLLGWYHTHPGLSVFLSGMDLFIHNHFFPQPWHLALVLDPLSRTIGVFRRHSRSGEVLDGPLLRWSWELALHAEKSLAHELEPVGAESQHGV